MADDDATLVKKITSDAERRRPEPPGDEVAAALVERFPGAVFVDRTASRSSTSTARRWHDVAAFLRDEQQFTMCVDVTAVDHSLDGERARRPTGVAPERFEVVANFLSHPRNRRIRVICAGARRRPDGADRSPTVYPGVELRRARGLRPLRHRRSTATPTSPASSCPTTGSATRCARTTRPRACR